MAAAAFAARRRFGNWGIALAAAALVPRPRGEAVRVPRALRGQLPPRVAIRRNTADEEVFEQVLLRGEYDFPELRELHVTSILDGGANVGYATTFLHSVFPHAHIVAVEPDEANIRQLRKNVRFAGIDQMVTCVHGAVWPRREAVSIVDPTVASWAFRVDRTTEHAAGKTQGYPLDALAQLAPSGSFDLIKLDIEGTERDIFREINGASVIAKAKAVLVELHDRVATGCSVAFYRWTVHRPFNQYIRGDSCLVVFEPAAGQ